MSREIQTPVRLMQCGLLRRHPFWRFKVPRNLGDSGQCVLVFFRLVFRGTSISGVYDLAHHCMGRNGVLSLMAQWILWILFWGFWILFSAFWILFSTFWSFGFYLVLFGISLGGEYPARCHSFRPMHTPVWGHAACAQAYRRRGGRIKLSLTEFTCVKQDLTFWICKKKVT